MSSTGQHQERALLLQQEPHGGEDLMPRALAVDQVDDDGDGTGERTPDQQRRTECERSHLQPCECCQSHHLYCTREALCWQWGTAVSDRLSALSLACLAAEIVEDAEQGVRNVQ